MRDFKIEITGRFDDAEKSIANIHAAAERAVVPVRISAEVIKATLTFGDATGGGHHLGAVEPIALLTTDRPSNVPVASPVEAAQTEPMPVEAPPAAPASAAAETSAAV